MNTGWVLFALFIGLLVIAGIGVWFTVWLEGRYLEKALSERQAVESEQVALPDKWEPR